MAIAEQQPRLPELHRGTEQEAPAAVNELADKWGRLTTIATLAVLPIWPLAFVIVDARWPGLSFLVTGLIATGAMVVTRGALDVLFHRWIPWPNLYGAEVARPRPREASRRARADHERLLAGHDRAGLLDGAHGRARRQPRGVRLG